MFHNFSGYSFADSIAFSLSDHFPIGICKKLPKQPSRYLSFTGRSYRDFNEDQFCIDLENADWTMYDQVVNPDIAWDIMYSNILKVVDAHCPFKEYHISKKRPPYITTEIISLSRDRDYHHKLAICSPENSPQAAYHCQLATSLRKTVNSNIKNSKQNFILNQFESSNNNPNKFWSTVSSLLLQVKSKVIEGVFSKDNGSFLTGYEASQEINSFFINVGSEIDARLPPPSDFLKFFDDLPCTIDQMAEFSIASTEIKLEGIDISKSSGIPNINSNLLKIALLNQKARFCRLLNLCDSSAIFPRLWKTSMVIPIPKKGDSRFVTNLRPVALLPIPGKILEKFLETHLSHYLSDNNILTPSQGGFRKNHSTQLTTFNLTENIASALNNNSFALVTYLDVSKAFDTINHSILLNKLALLGINGNFFSILVDYLRDRQQCTNFNGCISNKLPVKTGVPQGSIIGPILFNLYVNDVSYICFNSILSMYADDTALCCISPNLSQLECMMNNDLRLMNTWSVNNRLSLNAFKTKCTLFYSKRKKIINHLEIYLGNQLLEFVPCYKYLGFLLDRQLNFENHTARLLQRANAKATVLYKIRRYLNQHISLRLYKSLLLPILEYGDIFVLGNNMKPLFKLQKFQNRMLRLVLHINYRISNVDLHLRSNVLPLVYRRHLSICRVMFNLSFDVNRLEQTMNVRTRSAGAAMLSVPFPKSNFLHKSVFYQGFKIWNSLPVHLRMIRDYKLFKKKLKFLLMLSFQTTQQLNNVQLVEELPDSVLSNSLYL